MAKHLGKLGGDRKSQDVKAWGGSSLLSHGVAPRGGERWPAERTQNFGISGLESLHLEQWVFCLLPCDFMSDTKTTKIKFKNFPEVNWMSRDITLGR